MGELLQFVNLAVSVVGLAGLFIRLGRALEKIDTHEKLHEKHEERFLRIEGRL